MFSDCGISTSCICTCKPRVARARGMLQQQAVQCIDDSARQKQSVRAGKWVKRSTRVVGRTRLIIGSLCVRGEEKQSRKSDFSPSCRRMPSCRKIWRRLGSSLFAIRRSGEITIARSAERRTRVANFPRPVEGTRNTCDTLYNKYYTLRLYDETILCRVSRGDLHRALKIWV